MTTLTAVTNELEKANIPTNGSYSELPTLTYNLVIKILHFGENVVSESSLGSVVKEIAIDLAKKDGRKPVICDRTFKTILA